MPTIVFARLLRCFCFAPIFGALSIVLSFGHSEHDFEDPHHWELPSKDPDRIVLTWSEEPSTSQSVSWRTNGEIEKGYAEIALADPSARFDQLAERFEAKTEALEIGQSDMNPSRVDHYHSCVFRGLKPGTLYAYRVGDGDSRWSEWIQFRTVKAEAAPLRFLYFGDAQNGVLSHWSRTIRAAYKQAPDADFVIHAGDLINRSHRDHEWGEWFKAGGWIHASLPSIPVPGNHEYGSLQGGQDKQLSLQWRAQFTLPVTSGLPEILAETVYAHRIQDVLIVGLNSNREVEAQAAWLDKLLEEDDSAWRILTFHHPIFSSGKGRDNDTGRNFWKPVIDKHSVDLVLQGHDHTYARGHTPVRMSKSGGGPLTTMYVNSVSGPKMYEFMEGGWDVYQPEGVVLDRKAVNTQFFQVIDIDGANLVYRAYTTDGAVYDAFSLRKSRSGTKRILNDLKSAGPERTFDNTLPYGREGY